MIVSAFCRSAIFLFQLSLHDFFHYELLNLAGDGGGELSDKCDVFGNLNSVSKSSIRRFVITEKAPTRAFSWLKAATTAFTFKTLLRHYAKRALTPRSLNVKLGPRLKIAS